MRAPPPVHELFFGSKVNPSEGVRCCWIAEREEMEAIREADLRRVRAPSGGDMVYKDECIYSFQTPVGSNDVMVA